MRSLIFDAGPVISLTMNNLLWTLRELEEKYKGKFFITSTVKGELVDRPLTIKRFEFEALQVLRYIDKGIIEVIEDSRIKKKTDELLELANSCFKARGNFLKIVHSGEMGCLAACLIMNSDAIVVDERTTRMLVENPKRLAQILARKLHTRIDVDTGNLKEFNKLVENVKVIRSVELVTMAYEFGMLDKFIAKVKNPRRVLLDSVLWGVKLNGCSVSRKEIDQIIRLEEKR
ncbi:MAG: hypothetical protein QF824_00960 [Candidatus Woesearchaeota archaeon]|jgi:hypothetical protein|nr:hypothetical protein [Candidatus Woesearchaeota archaeon]|tara:strand:- start:400 stop:1092 length:693 start_codon:yes stop_codon:yes gene_type:complete